MSCATPPEKPVVISLDLETGTQRKQVFSSYCYSSLDNPLFAPRVQQLRRRAVASDCLCSRASSAPMGSVSLTHSPTPPSPTQ